MITFLGIGAFIVTTLVYAVRAGEVRHDKTGPRKRKRWISGAGVCVVAPVLILLSRDPGVDLGVLGVLLGVLLVCCVMFIASLVRSNR